MGTIPLFTPREPRGVCREVTGLQHLQFSGSSDASSGSAFCQLIAVMLPELLCRENQKTDAPKPTEVMGSFGLKTSSVQDLDVPSVSGSAPGQQRDITLVPLIALPKNLPIFVPLFYI